MPNLFSGFFTQLATGDQLRDYQHASRLFLSSNYAHHPKYSWLFHVFFDLNPEFSSLTNEEFITTGMLVKAADLPKFTFETKTYNNYNRPHIAQSKVRYDDINITFHDDSSNFVRKLWFDYFNFYYRDMDNDYGDATGSLNPVYLNSNKQKLGDRHLYNKFGYTPRSPSNISNQYIYAIRIYSLHNKRFSEYTLINPTIRNYRHGSHVNGQEGTLENVMTISYESILYASGKATLARGFADLNYDKSPSPLSVLGGGTNSILGPGGILNAADEIISDGANGQFGLAAFKSIRAFTKNKGLDFKNVAKTELTGLLRNVARGQNPFINTFIPYRGSANNPGFQSAIAEVTATAPGSATSNGGNIVSRLPAINGGVASAISGATISANSDISGALSDSSGKLVGGDINQIINVSKTSLGKLQADSSSLIPTNSFTAAIQTANDRLKQEAVGLDNIIPTFASGTNNLVSSASALAQTPLGSKQFSFTADLASKLANEKFTIPDIRTYTGGTSTNPITTT